MKNLIEVECENCGVKFYTNKELIKKAEKEFYATWGKKVKNNKDEISSICDVCYQTLNPLLKENREAYLETRKILK